MSVSDLVGEIEGVRRRTRRATAGAAVPLALLGLLVAAASVVYGAATATHVGDGSTYGELTFPLPEPTLLDRLLWVHSISTRYDGVGYYWLIGAPLVFVAMAAYYRWRAQRTGLSVNGGRVAAAGAGVFAVLVATMAYGAFGNYGWGFDEGIRLGDFVSPFLVVALGVFVLAWVERSVLAAVTGVVYVAALVFAHVVTFHSTVNNGWEAIASWGPMVLYLGLILLAGAAVAAVRERSAARRG